MGSLFDDYIDRLGTDSLKWKVKKDEIPMWVADMDFKAPVPVLEALKRRIDHGVFGYGTVTKEWYWAISQWWKRRYDFEIKKEWLRFCTAVIPAISSIIRGFSSLEDEVLIQTPVYNGFFSAINGCGRKVLENPLVYTEEGYFIDFKDLEEKLSRPRTKIMILCNPHNPIGRIWSKKELSFIGELCERYNVLVISDEIHCDFTDPGKKYTPFASVSKKCSDISVTAIAPTKTFNLAGIKTAAVFSSNEAIYKKVSFGIENDGIGEPNSFAIAASVAAYNECEKWLEDLRQYIFKNKLFAKAYIEENIPKMRLVSSDATYLLWLDCNGYNLPKADLSVYVRNKTGLYLSEGSIYGENGKGFLRMNISCPFKTLKEGLKRLKTSFE